MYLIDANIFLEVELAQEKGALAKEALKKFRDGTLRGIIPDFHVDTIVVVMENYGLGWREVRAFLSGFLGYKGLSICFVSLRSRINATRYMEKFGLSFDDGLVYQCMKENKIKKILSYDKGFDALPDVERVEPEELRRI